VGKLTPAVLTDDLGVETGFVFHQAPQSSQGAFAGSAFIRGGQTTAGSNLKGSDLPAVARAQRKNHARQGQNQSISLVALPSDEVGQGHIASSLNDEKWAARLNARSV